MHTRRQKIRGIGGRFWSAELLNDPSALFLQFLPADHLLEGDELLVFVLTLLQLGLSLPLGLQLLLHDHLSSLGLLLCSLQK